MMFGEKSIEFAEKHFSFYVKNTRKKNEYVRPFPQIHL